MGKLVYSMLTSVDGYVADSDGSFDWAVPDAEAHGFINEAAHSIGTCLMGRRMYQTMVVWETPEDLPEMTPEMREYAELWRGQDKVVYSTTLAEVASERTRIERAFDAGAVRALKAGSARDLSIDGPTLAAHAIRAGLVDEYVLYVCPVVVGGGTRFFPDNVHLDLELVDQRAFTSGILALRYVPRS